MKYQRLFTNDQRLLKIHSLKAIRKNSYEIFSFLCKTNPILSVFRPKTLISQKNKPNSNPIQSQFNPKQTQFKPKQTQFKPNFLLRKDQKLLSFKAKYSVISTLSIPPSLYRLPWAAGRCRPSRGRLFRLRYLFAACCRPADYTIVR